MHDPIQLGKIFIYESELQYISRYVIDFPEAETGGDLFGLWTKEGFPVVEFAIGPGQKAIHGRAHFNQDIGYLHQWGALLHHAHGLEHIGAWHSHHHLRFNEPSPGDILTMRNALRGTGFSRFVICIVNMDEQAEVSLGAFLFLRDNLDRHHRCSWQVLEGTSPVRQSLPSDMEKHFRHPHTAADQVSCSLVAPEQMPPETILKNPGKPDLPADSFWTKAEGQRYLREVFDKLRERKDLQNVELLQLADKRIAISFSHDSARYEIRFPHNFPESKPDVVEKVGFQELLNVFRSEKRRKSRISRLMQSLKLFD
ncbi:MAG: hypothetical protein KatS3mg031_2692 [Chitinophagales bacterium]|nr:MAG: hypothetical protein KatS3mg031_2692 [Chitinophagales bacterium]